MVSKILSVDTQFALATQIKALFTPIIPEFLHGQNTDLSDSAEHFPEFRRVLSPNFLRIYAIVQRVIQTYDTDLKTELVTYQPPLHKNWVGGRD